jgi:hypothetical protein
MGRRFMRIRIVITVALLIAVQNVNAQQGDRQSTPAKPQLTSKPRAVTAETGVTVPSGSRIDAILTSPLDLMKAKAGDMFRLKAVRPVRSNGKEVISKGSLITGRIEKISVHEKEIMATLVFEHLEDVRANARGALEARITSVIPTKRTFAPLSMDEKASMSTTERGGQPRSTTTNIDGVVVGVDEAGKGSAGKTTPATETVDSDESGSRATEGRVRIGTGPVRLLSEATTASSRSTIVVSSSKPKVEKDNQFVLRTTIELKIERDRPDAKKYD